MIADVEESIRESEIIEQILKNINYDMRLGRDREAHDKSKNWMQNWGLKAWFSSKQYF